MPQLDTSIRILIWSGFAGAIIGIIKFISTKVPAVNTLIQKIRSIVHILWTSEYPTDKK